MKCCINFCLRLFGCIFFLCSCKKEEIDTVQNNLSYFGTAVSFLKLQQNARSYCQVKKIDTLLQSLSPDNVREISLAGNKVILCELNSYKNKSKTKFKYTYYKIAFFLKNDIVVSGLVYTINTDLSKQLVDLDIQDILMRESESFSGEIVTNSLNDRFIQSVSMEKGRLKKSFELQTRNPISDSLLYSSMSSGDCTAYYLVTTTYFPDGHVESSWEYLFTLCGSCYVSGQQANSIECDEASGSGGGEGMNNVETYSVTESATDVDENYVSAPGINYIYHATVTRVNGEVTGVIVDPTTVSNPVSWYVDNYGRNTKRSITLFGHSNGWMSLGVTALINWSCLVHGKWVYSDNSPIYSRQWSNSKQAIR